MRITLTAPQFVSEFPIVGVALAALLVILLALTLLVPVVTPPAVLVVFEEDMLEVVGTAMAVHMPDELRKYPVLQVIPQTPLVQTATPLGSVLQTVLLHPHATVVEDTKQSLAEEEYMYPEVHVTPHVPELHTAVP